MHIIFCIICTLLVYSVSAQRSAFIGNDSTYNMVRELQEVIVTAEKRQLNPVNIPTALTVVTPKIITGENSLDLRNISGIVPNFYMQEGGLKLSTPLYVRGIGTISGIPSVGLYINGVPVFDKNAFIFELYDIQQIEVLRGPQTTLYGRNSINGLININTKTPHSKFALQAGIGYSSYSSQNYRIILNLPIKNYYNRLSFSYNKSKGYFKNRYENNKKSNPSDSYHIRYQGRVLTPLNWDLKLGVEHSHSYDGGYAYAAADSLRNERYVVNYNTPSSYRRNLTAAHINLNKRWEQLNFSSVSSYAHTNDKQFLDADFTCLDVFDNQKKSHQHLYTQEFTLQSSQKQRIEWTIGAFGFYKDLTNKYIANFGTDRFYLLPMKLDHAKYYNNTTTWGIAGYGQVAIRDIWPGMTFTAGLRYDYEKTELDYRDSLLFSGSEQYSSYHQSNKKRDFDAWFPKFSLLQQWNSQLSLYLSISKGYKAGGYNIISNDMSSQLVQLQYNAEKLWNYEIGMKYFSQNHKFNLNAAVFFIDWKDQQIFTMGMMGPALKNAGDAQTVGCEVDMHCEFIPCRAYFLAMGYTHAQYYHNANKAHEGNRIVMAPEFTGNTGLRYNKKVNVSWFQSFAASTSVNGFGTQYFDEANLLKQKPYFLWNLEFGISAKHWEFKIWGKNILDKAFFSYMLNNPVGNKLPQYNNMGQSGAPARLGASITFNI